MFGKKLFFRPITFRFINLLLHPTTASIIGKIEDIKMKYTFFLFSSCFLENIYDLVQSTSVKVFFGNFEQYGKSCGHTVAGRACKQIFLRIDSMTILKRKEIFYKERKYICLNP